MKKPKYKGKKCRQCDKLFFPEHPNTRVCSVECVAARKVDAKNRSYANVNGGSCPGKHCAECGTVFYSNRPNRLRCRSEACRKAGRAKTREAFYAKTKIE